MCRTPRLQLLTALLLLLPVFIAHTSALLFGIGDAKEKPVQGDYMRPSVTAVEILEAKGYRAREWYFTTKDGYILNIVRGTNPLFNKGDAGLKSTLPLLFIAGTDLTVSLYLTNAVGVRPKNFRKRVGDLARVLDGARLMELVDHDPSVRSLPFLAMNFGYECWFLERRGYGKSDQRVGHQNRTLADALKSIPVALIHHGFTPQAGMTDERPRGEHADPLPAGELLDAEGKVLDRADLAARRDEAQGMAAFWRDFFQQAVSLDNLPGALSNFGDFEKNFIHTFDPKYWNFSLDEVAKYDLPQAVDFVLRKSGKPRLHITGVSSGGALILLAAAETPQLAHKIQSAVLWAPSLNMGASSDIIYLLSFLAPWAQSYAGPLPLVFLSRQLVGVMQSICATRLAQRSLCARLVDTIFGYSGHRTHITQANLATFIQPMSTHELMQLGQFAHTPVPCKFNFSTPEVNEAAYGQPEAPCYDLGRVRLKNIHIYQGNTDSLVSWAAVNHTVAQLGVPARVTHISEPGLFFNHGGFLFHDDCGRLAIGPSLLDMARAERRDPQLAAAASSDSASASRLTLDQLKLAMSELGLDTQRAGQHPGQTLASAMLRMKQKTKVITGSSSSGSNGGGERLKSGAELRQLLRGANTATRKSAADPRFKAESFTNSAGNLVTDFSIL